MRSNEAYQGAMNPYEYSGTNPILRRDPSGLCWSLDCDKVGLLQCLAACVMEGSPAIDFCVLSCRLCAISIGPHNPACIACAGCVAGFVGCSANCVYTNCTSTWYDPPKVKVPCHFSRSIIHHGANNSVTGCTCVYRCGNGSQAQRRGILWWRSVGCKSVPYCACEDDIWIEVPGDCP